MACKSVWSGPSWLISHCSPTTLLLELSKVFSFAGRAAKLCMRFWLLQIKAHVSCFLSLSYFLIYYSFSGNIISNRKEYSTVGFIFNQHHVAWHFPVFLGTANRVLLLWMLASAKPNEEGTWWITMPNIGDFQTSHSIPMVDKIDWISISFLL